MKETFSNLLPWSGVSTDIEVHWAPEHVSDVKLAIQLQPSDSSSLGLELEGKTQDGRHRGVHIQEHEALGVGLLASTSKLDQIVHHVYVVRFRLDPLDIVEAGETHLVAKDFDGQRSRGVVFANVHL